MAVRDLFLSCADAAGDLLASDEVAAAWDEPSALEGYSVRGLAGHLARGVLVVEQYLERSGGDAGAAPEAGSASGAGDLVDASAYFVTVLGDHDPVSSELHRGVRERATTVAADGSAALAETVRAAARRLEASLDEATLQRPIEVFDGLRMSVGAYVATRLVELVVHTDDLAVSVGASAAPSEDACRVVAGILAEIAARREGGLNAVRALARRERHPEALRAL